MRLLTIAFTLVLAPVVLRPGDREIASDHLGEATETVRIMKADSEIGRFHYDWHLMPNDGLLLVIKGEVQSKVFWDSTLVKRHGLAPVWERDEFDGKAKQWTYDGARVNEHTYDGPVFNFQELDDLVRSLPLRQGYEKILPLYSEGDDSLEMDTVRVVGRAGGRWTLRFADPVIVATYEVDEKTRWIVRHENVFRKSGVIVKLVQQ